MLRAPPDGGPRACLRIALRDGTPGVEFLERKRVVATRAMDAGDALLYDTRAWHREPVGDWRRTVDFFLLSPPAAPAASWRQSGTDARGARRGAARDAARDRRRLRHRARGLRRLRAGVDAPRLRAARGAPPGLGRAWRGPAFSALLEARLAGRDALARLVDAALHANLLNAPQ